MHRAEQFTHRLSCTIIQSTMRLHHHYLTSPVCHLPLVQVISVCSQMQSLPFSLPALYHREPHYQVPLTAGCRPGTVKGTWQELEGLEKAGVMSSSLHLGRHLRQRLLFCGGSGSHCAARPLIIQAGLPLFQLPQGSRARVKCCLSLPLQPWMRQWFSAVANLWIVPSFLCALALFMPQNEFPTFNSLC